MIRLFNAYFPTRTLLLTVTEALLVTLGFVTAVVYWAGTATDANIYLLYENGLGRIGLVVGIFVLLMYYFDLYDSIVLSNRREVVTRLVGVLGCSFVSIAVLYYAFPELRLVGTTLWMGVGIVAVTVPAWRKLFFVLNRSARFSERAILYGDGPLALPLMDAIASRSELGVRVVGFVGQATEPGAGVPRFDDVDLEELVEQRNVRRIVVTMGDRRGKLKVDKLLRLKTKGVYIQDGPEYYESITGKIPLDSLRLSWLLFSPGFHVRTALRLYKRVFSLVLGGLAILVTSPIMLLALIAIRLDSPGPAIFRQKRVGENGKLFTVFKFRSMYDGSDKKQLRPAEHDDDRVTRVGKWLRRTRIDELPQLFNIVKGDMAFVGPRPFVPEQEEECAAKIQFYKERWLVKPGATGWAQINRGYNATLEDNREKLAYDLFYIKNVSLGLDLFIMFSTVKILLLGRGGR
ncbi:MAG TPA: exopolysaccharide biosynthesis polyprenyl glycosylphosphotransferase [Terriglobales bacterium]|nr:exopolysaccharide biosynthesis polyprenyl glycosylphosphotransferase [Terriglobales bacterium]